MSELNNPLFEDQREFLERQKDEYKHALMGDVDHLKAQGEEIGKKVAMAGGVLLAGYLLKRLFSRGGDKKKSRKVKKAKKRLKASGKSSTAKEPASFDPRVYKVEESHPAYGTTNHTSTAVAKGFMKSDLAQAISQQVVALLMIYISKKVEEYLNSVSENNDIAAAPLVVTEIETTEYIVPEENAL
ncbi:hypothetical protein [Pontibacter chitinilyticus]|uniref:hypothetical protein n=1 Tax=Pontibacter chitinilyticus TaxID=2674989 RepID=UPI00321A0865